MLPVPSYDQFWPIGFPYRKSRRKTLLRARVSSRALASCDCKKVTTLSLVLLDLNVQFVFQPRSQHADISELDLKKGTSINFPEGKDKLLHFEIKIQPEEGTYKYVSR